MPSAVQRGAYYKARTRRWLEAQGYQIFELEVVRWVKKPGGERIPIKRDQLGSDLGGMREDGYVFCQVKGGAQARGGGQFPPAQREFRRYRWGPASRRWIVCWAPRVREPRVIEVW